MRLVRTDPPSKPVQSVVGGVPTNWVMMGLPTLIMVLRVYNTKAVLGALAVVALLTFAQRDHPTRVLALGPLVAMIAATMVVLMNPDPGQQGGYLGIVFFFLLTLVAVRLVATTDARSVIASLIDGVGVYLVTIVLAYRIGVQPLSANRVGGLIESTGFVRIFFPFTTALDEPPTLAAVYIAAAPFLLLTEKRWRFFRLACLLAAVFVAWSSGSRSALLIALALPLLGLLLPRTLRWTAPVTALFASLSFLLLPGVMKAVNSVATPIFYALAPGRDTGTEDIQTLSNRTVIWSRSMAFWRDHVENAQNQLFGFGQSGQYRAGASISYIEFLGNVARNAARATLHNSFLQQVFDGGLIGWLLLTSAIVWTCVRFTQRLQDWGAQGTAAAMAISALLVASTTSVIISPGFLQGGFLTLVVLVVISCQVPDRPTRRPESPTDTPARSL